MSKIITNRDVSDILQIIEAQWNEAILISANSPHCKLYEKKEITLLSSTVDYPFFNGALHTKIESNIEEKIDQVTQFFKDRKYFWHIGPTTRPTNIPETLEDNGFHPTTSPCMAANLSELEPIESNLEIKKVTDIDELEQWTRTFTSGFDIPHTFDKWWTMFSSTWGQDLGTVYYTGFIDGIPVATSLAFYRSGVVGIYDVAVIPAARRKGYGSVITVHPLLEGLKLGYRVGVLHSSKMGYKVYERLGFKEYGQITRYLSP